MSATRSIDTPSDCPDWPPEFAARYIADGYWEAITFPDLLHTSATRFPDNVAVVDGDERLTYEELHLRVDRLASGLENLGIQRGDNVVVQLSNRLAFVEVYFALMMLAARPVLALPAHRLTEIERLCDVAGAVAYITEDGESGFDYREIARSLAERRPALRWVIVVGDSAEFVALSDLYDNPVSKRVGPQPSDVACFQLSGGTTGAPKLVPRQHREYIYNARASAALCQFDAGTTYLAALPMAHNFPMCCPGFIGVLQSGGRVVLTKDPGPDAAFPLIKRERVTATALVPPLALLWVEAIGVTGYDDLLSLRLLQVGGAKLGPEGARRVTSAFRCQLQQVFGMAEGLICYTRLNDPEERVLQTQGFPLSPGDEIRVVNDGDNDVPVGVVGSLLTRGPYTVRGYYRAPEHNATAFTADGYYRTGDRARLTADGYVVVEGRDKDQINRGGEKISAEEIEDILLSHPSVINAAVVAIPDDALGERICAFVVSRSPAPTAIALKNFVRSTSIAAFKVPDRVQYVEAFPETGVGKTSRKELRQKLQEAYVRGSL